MTAIADLARTECDCPKCSSWCEHVPGWFIPGEAEKAAELKGMALVDFFARYLTVDYWSGDTAFTLRPRTIDEAGGVLADYDPRGKCVFYVNGRCDIHEAKPHECATAKHDVELPDDWHEQTANAWRGAPQSQIAELYGEMPEEPEANLWDMFAAIGRLR